MKTPDALTAEVVALTARIADLKNQIGDTGKYLGVRVDIKTHQRFTAAATAAGIGTGDLLARLIAEHVENLKI